MGMLASFQAIPADTMDAARADPAIAWEGGFEHEVDVDKAWHGLHWLLTGTDWTVSAGAGEAILGGERIGDDDEDEDVRLLAPERVAAVAAALASLPRETLAARYDPPAMAAAKIYPDIWVRDGAEALDYLLHYYDELAEFYAGAAERGDGVLASIG